MAGGSLGASAQAYHDITSAYLLNAGFDANYTYAVGDEGNAAPNDINSVNYWDVTSVKAGVLGVCNGARPRPFAASVCPPRAMMAWLVVAWPLAW